MREVIQRKNLEEIQPFSPHELCNLLGIEALV